MINWWIHLSCSQATRVILLAALAIGYVLTDDIEDPRAWRFLRLLRRLYRRYLRRLRPVMATRWDGATVLAIPATGWSLAWLQTAGRLLTSPWRRLCAWVTQRRARKIGPALAEEPSSYVRWQAVDYSAKRARALEQLGDDYLLARPISRKMVPR